MNDNWLSEWEFVLQKTHSECNLHVLTLEWHKQKFPPTWSFYDKNMIINRPNEAFYIFILRKRYVLLNPDKINTELFIPCIHHTEWGTTSILLKKTINHVFAWVGLLPIITSTETEPTILNFLNVRKGKNFGIYRTVAPQWLKLFNNIISGIFWT